jgi:hypothetical protein
MQTYKLFVEVGASRKTGSYPGDDSGLSFIVLELQAESANEATDRLQEALQKLIDDNR